jgi:hypothetical protein
VFIRTDSEKSLHTNPCGSIQVAWISVVLSTNTQSFFTQRRKSNVGANRMEAKVEKKKRTPFLKITFALL